MKKEWSAKMMLFGFIVLVITALWVAEHYYGSDRQPASIRQTPELE